MSKDNDDLKTLQTAHRSRSSATAADHKYRRINMTKPSKIGFAVIGALIAALVAGYLGGRLGSDGSGGGGSTDVSKASWIDEIKDKGELRVGCADSPPTTVVAADGTCSGPDLIPRQNLANELDVKMRTIATSWQSIVAGLQADHYDVAANLDQTVERGLSIQFSHPSWSYPGVFLLPKSANLRSTEQIVNSGKPVATAQGTALDAALQAAKIPELRVDNYQNATSAVEAGRASAVFTDLGTAVDAANKRPDLGIVIPQPPIFVHHVAYGLPAGIDPRSLQIFNIAVDNAVASGEIERAFSQAGYREQDELGAMEIKP
jgi:polar amino acid transport system substrate-binding protein